ncbi:MAG TPA: L,D-transpeptidase family protein, partial [Gemmatimonadaceae bacterium]|nr:L,D-transpeptidase family protein [Gemmatimonadaceae bacterium]
MRASLLIAAAGGCSTEKNAVKAPEQEAPWAPARLTSVLGVPAAEIEASIKRKLDGAAPDKIDEDQWGHTRRLYKVYGGNPLWLDPNGFHGDRVFALANAVLQTEQDGMRIDAYPVASIAQALAIVETSKPSADQLADADIILTASFAALGEDYLTGQVDPKSVAQNWHIDPLDENVDSALVRAIRVSALDKSLTSMRPQDPDYTALRKSLDQYQQLVIKGGWPGVPEGKPAKPGERMAAERVSVLRQRLAAEGYLPAEPAQNASANGVYDPALAGAVANFQAHHAIAVDSMLGKETLDALNQSAAYRAAQIAANLERLRWLPRSFGSRYIYVNVPAFRLSAYDQGQKALDMKVIVGQDYEDKATPVFSDVMETVVFRPYWNVTPDIAAKEIFPKMSSGYLAANNYELYQENGETRVRQKPGDKNALGLVKFLFPNDFNIYLHDTPNHELFEKDVRAFSHGCIRVEKPSELAQWVLGWDAGRVDAAMHGSDNNAVKVPQKIPVFITYGTAYIRDGQLYFGNDLYDRDDKLVAQVM